MVPPISSPLRLLVLAPLDTPHPVFLRDLSHHEIRTPYYSASVPIWRDTLPITTPNITSFREEWTATAAGEVVQAIGAWVVCFRKPAEKADLEALRTILSTIHAVIEYHNGESYASNEPLLLAVGMQQNVSSCLEVDAEGWEDLGRECGGWEWIDGEIEVEVGTNDFGEKVGIPRLKETLEAHEWEGGGPDGLSDYVEFGSGDEAGFGAEAAQMEREMLGLKMAVHGEEGSEEGGDEGVEELENMMMRMQAIKDMGADMPEAERRRFAASAVKDVMKKL